jgi:hypothetical protein
LAFLTVKLFLVIFTHNIGSSALKTDPAEGTAGTTATEGTMATAGMPAT